MPTVVSILFLILREAQPNPLRLLRAQLRRFSFFGLWFVSFASSYFSSGTCLDKTHAVRYDNDKLSSGLVRPHRVFAAPSPVRVYVQSFEVSRGGCSRKGLRRRYSSETPVNVSNLSIKKKNLCYQNLSIPLNTPLDAPLHPFSSPLSLSLCQCLFVFFKLLLLSTKSLWYTLHIETAHRCSLVFLTLAVMSICCRWNVAVVLAVAVSEKSFYQKRLFFFVTNYGKQKYGNVQHATPCLSCNY